MLYYGVTPKHRSRPAVFSVSIPRLIPCLPSCQPSNGSTDSLLLCTSMQMCASFVSYNSLVLRGVEIVRDKAAGIKLRLFSTLCTLFSLSIRQPYYFQSFAHSRVVLLHKSENQLLSFQSRAHDFVDMWGVYKKFENLKCHFCFASHRDNSALHSTAVDVRASARRAAAAEPIKEPQWS
jgi:hypothetical protein